ncbi:mannose-1-phosphate guanylyltransferase [Deinococcus aquiradiocola]|uniref:mannose-1-phosphate guanylyltransferase n=1 Tax=Deinococcus aquiradiocola TaxID=393059 RepID=A0A917PKV4_9DEIO|nr:mannose-1-phosphate guanylyltransferase [Deinococcus aquiradiocola]GGJ82670.1 mannose-1-phosphate guanylyltransferase [Deinococcus aquiradiocola]
MSAHEPSGSTAPQFYPVILAGGSGERFWPLSRKSKPKQFLTLDDSGFSLIQATVNRLATLPGVSVEDVMIVTGVDHRMQVLQHLPDLPTENLLVEPVARDTAAAVLYAALKIEQLDPDGLMGVFHSDHRVDRPDVFADVVGRAIALASERDVLVTLGIAPTYPSIAYGYIERGEEVGGQQDFPAYRVARFTEKPDAETAAGFLATGRFSWNSGMFIWKVRTILEAFARYQPELLKALRAAVATRGGIRTHYPDLEKISIDYAILEKAENVVVIPAEFGWDDLGDWNALERLLRGHGENVAVGRHVGIDTGGAILYTTDGDDLIATIGLEDVVVVRTAEVTLVVHKDRTQDIKKLVQKIKENPELERFA